MVSQESPHALGPSSSGDPALFKKHKVLPHPTRNKPTRINHAIPVRYPLEQHYSAASSSSSDRSPSQSSRVQSLRHRSRRIGSGPEMPPTPPTHSRSSSSTQSILASSPTCIPTPEASFESVTTPERPSTPRSRQNPPTPDVTPPGPAITRPKRPVSSQRPRTHTLDTFRTESCRTVPEYPTSDDEKSGRSRLRSQPPSSKASQNTIRRVADSTDKGEPKTPKLVGLGLGLGSGPQNEDGNTTPKGNGDQFLASDKGNRASGEAEAEAGWDAYFGKARSTKKHRASTAPLSPNDRNGGKPEVVEDDMISPTNATKALRTMALQEKKLIEQSPSVVKETADDHGIWTLPAGSRSSIDNDVDSRRISTISTKSTVSTVVEAILVDVSPQRQKTLRHVRRATGLRDSTSDLVPASPRSSIQTQMAEDRGSPRRVDRPPKERRHGSVASNGTASSISSNKARRDIWKSGGVPVVIVPDRRSSVQSSRPQSLRSTSSRRSKRSDSVGSVPLSSMSPSKDLAPYFERPSRRCRATMSESESSDSQRTIDYPPIVPIRRSSLSAPTSRNTSRNTSRAASLTAESLKSHETLQQSLTRKEERQPAPPAVKLERAATIGPERPTSSGDENTHHAENHHLNVDTNGDPFFGRRHSIHKTPFSQASVDTNGTLAAEVSEAMAVNIYTHQYSSVVMVDHSGGPSESSDEWTKAQRTAVPKVVTSNPEGDAPATPPQATRGLSMEDLDSPLRNPRDPPALPVFHHPPVLALIPATPSGTPAIEKQKMLGNFYDELVCEKPRRPSLVRRTFSRHRYLEDKPSRFSDGGQSSSLLKRTFSLSRNIRRGKATTVGDKGKEPLEADDYPTSDKPPPDESKLHPFWRPQYSESDEEDSDDSDPDMLDDEEHDDHHRYPAGDNRPPHPRRSLSSRLKRTFAILPAPSDRDYPVASSSDPNGDNRTINRTPSGNLRVLKNRRISLESFHREHGLDHADEERPYTAPDRAATSPVRMHSLRHKPRFLVGMQHHGNGIVKPRSPSPRGKPRRSNSKLRDMLGEYGIGNLPRRLSERRREKRSRELRAKISGPREVRDGVGDVIRRGRVVREGFPGAQPRV